MMDLHSCSSSPEDNCAHKAILALEPAEGVLAAAQVSGKGVESAADGASAVSRLTELLPAHRVWERFPTTGRFAD